MLVDEEGFPDLPGVTFLLAGELLHIVHGVCVAGVSDVLPDGRVYCLPSVCSLYLVPRALAVSLTYDLLQSSQLRFTPTRTACSCLFDLWV